MGHIQVHHSRHKKPVVEDAHGHSLVRVVTRKPPRTLPPLGPTNPCQQAATQNIPHSSVRPHLDEVKLSIPIHVGHCLKPEFLELQVLRVHDGATGGQLAGSGRSISQLVGPADRALRHRVIRVSRLPWGMWHLRLNVTKSYRHCKFTRPPPSVVKA